MEKRKKKWGDRRDGWWLRELPGMTQFTPHLYPNRADNEAYINVDIDLRPLDDYLAKKNAGRTEDKYTYFHLISAAIGKAFVLRPKMNRFIAYNRVYQRKYISVAFVVKKKFEDKSEEGLAFQYFDENSTLDGYHQELMQTIHQCRRTDVKDPSSDMMDRLVRLPRPILRLVMHTLFFLDRHGKVPQGIIATDPNYSSIFISNLGSIGLECGYHHLTNWGTCSIFCIIGEKSKRPVFHEDGTVEMREMLDLGLTIDERLADGYYYSKTIRLLKKLLETPELLETPAAQEIEY